MTDTIKNRYDFVLLFDVKDGNPNGDPDADNEPRFDPEDNRGLVTDVCLKRKIRNHVALTRNGDKGYDIFVGEGAVLNRKQKEAREDVRAKNKDVDKRDIVYEAQKEMCARYFDVRTFGAVMSTGKTEKDDADCGQVKGPVQLTFSRSIDPVTTALHTITRMAATNEKDEGKGRTMGEKYTVPYALYRCHGHISAAYAQKTGFSEDDLKLLFEALERMFWEDQSAARGEMAVQGLYVFQHDSILGNAPAHALLDRVQVACRPGVDVPRAFADYAVSVDETALPQGVTLLRIVDVPALKKAA